MQGGLCCSHNIIIKLNIRNLLIMHGNADCLSRLPLADIDSSLDNGEDKMKSYIASMEMEMEILTTFPIHYHQLLKHSRKTAFFKRLLGMTYVFAKAGHTN